MKVEDILQAAGEKNTPQERADYLDAACAGDRALRALVESLLKAHDQAGSSVQEIGTDTPPTREYTIRHERPGSVIGPYKLLQQIGEGGMGTVWMAEQTAPVQRRVALKIIKPGLDSYHVIARLEAERQALALMDHPNIAKILDAGTIGDRSQETGDRIKKDDDSLLTPDSCLLTPSPDRPYFVMELVKGQQITKYCDDSRLSLRGRLELFLSVCNAIQHAHQKGIIHRDIKPSNVLVTSYDHGAPGVVKVIDFGVAKATGQPLTERTLFTEFGAVVGTLEYMSPEQAELTNQDIDTRSDIYSLGVLLYSLLTGTTPFSSKQLRDTSFPEGLRLIREVDPPPPSTRMAEHEKAAPHSEFRAPRLHELDWIVMKALEKNRNRRYETANGLALDVQRFLADEPVQAGPPSTSYRLRKFIRRNKRPLAAALAFVLLLMFAVGGLTVALLAVSDQREQTQKALLAVSHEKTQTQSALEAEAKRRRQYREVLDRQTSFILEDLLGRQPILTKEHRQFLRQALTAYEEFAADAGPEREARAGSGQAHDRVGYIRRTLGEFIEAETAFRAGLTTFQALSAEFPEETAYRARLAFIHNNLGAVLSDVGRPKDAEAAYADAIAIYRRLAAEVPDDGEHRHALALSLQNLAQVFEQTGHHAEAAKAFLEGLRLQEGLVAESPKAVEYRARLAGGYRNYAHHLSITAAHVDGEIECRKSLALYRQLIAESVDGPEFRSEFAGALHQLATMVRQRKDLDEAISLYREAEMVRAQLSADFPAVPKHRANLAETHFLVGSLLMDKGELDNAETELRAAVNLGQRLTVAFPNSPDYGHNLARSRISLGLALYRRKQPAEAETVTSEALAAMEKLVADYPAMPYYVGDLASALGNLAVYKNGAKDYAAAGRYLDRAAPYHQAALKSNPANEDFRAHYRNNRYTRTITHLRLAEHAQAATVAEQMVAAIVHPGFDHSKAASLFSRIAETAAKDTALSEDKRKELASKHADRAMGLLKEAHRNGYRDANELKTNTSFDSLRNRDDFKELIRNMEATSK